MGRVIQLEAIYREGVFQPLEPLRLPEDQQVTISVYLPESAAPEVVLREWAQVYSALDQTDIDEIESIALDRANFSGE